MSAADDQERAILDYFFGSGSPSTWYIGLTSTVPNDDGTAFTEPVGMSYARVAVTNNATNWPAASTVAGVTRKVNGVAITFPNPSGAWGGAAGIVGWGAFTASVGGTPKFFQLLDTVIFPKSGHSPVEFAPGDLWMTAD